MNAAPVFLLVGLGNPGPRYQHDRHNAGFMVAEELRRRHNLPGFRSRFAGLVSEGTLAGRRVALLLPMTFMNLSGQAVGQAARWYRLPAEQILVMHDEVELPFGEVRLKEGGGLGGHNGLRSIVEALGTRDFWRLRVGIGRPSSPHQALADYVLEPFAEPKEEVILLVERAADLAEEWLTARGEAACLT